MIHLSIDRAYGFHPKGESDTSGFIVTLAIGRLVLEFWATVREGPKWK